jgi:hypothetical protein
MLRLVYLLDVLTVTCECAATVAEENLDIKQQETSKANSQLELRTK